MYKFVLSTDSTCDLYHDFVAENDIRFVSLTYTMEKDGVTLLIDAMSYQYLVGAKIDFKSDLMGEQFVIDNPNAVTTCGCGQSFGI